MFVNWSKCTSHRRPVEKALDDSLSKHLFNLPHNTDTGRSISKPCRNCKQPCPSTKNTVFTTSMDPWATQGITDALSVCSKCFRGTLLLKGKDLKTGCLSLQEYNSRNMDKLRPKDAKGCPKIPLIREKLLTSQPGLAMGCL